MKNLTPWLVVLMYLVPIIGTLASMRRRAKSIWSIGDSLRRLFPDDRFYRKTRELFAGYQTWRTRHPVAKYLNLELLNLTAGKIEYAFGHFRDYTVGVYMMAAFVIDLTLMVFAGSQVPHLRAHRFPSLFYHGFFALLSLWTYRRHVTTGLQMTEFMRANPLVHPQEFFDHYYRRLGPAAIPVPATAARTVDPRQISYRTGQPTRQSVWLLLKGVYDTAIFARSAFKALETIGAKYGREVFDVMASLWGSRMLQIFRTELIVEGSEKFHDLAGKIILVFNHKSHLDFVFNFFALSATHRADGRKIRPRYMAAKDHFVDNKFVYTGLGVGKLIENVDMVFVDRTGKGKQAIGDACARLVDQEIEVAMYPQGTRAVANYERENRRRDAGYYTTGTANSLKGDLGHLKKGCAFLAIDTANALRQAGRDTPVHLVFVGIDGTATLVPKGSFKVQTEATVKFTVGETLTLHPMETEGLEKPDGPSPQTEGQERYLQLAGRLQKGIDRGLVRALALHEKLRDRFVGELKKNSLAPKEKILKITHRLTDSERESNPLPFILLDRTYALPPEEQNDTLKRIAEALGEGGDLTSLKDEATDRLFRHRGRELETITRQEKYKKAG